MMTEKTIIHTVEITKIIPAGKPIPPVDDMSHRLSAAILAVIDCDHANVVKCQIFEMEDHHEQS